MSSMIPFNRTAGNLFSRDFRLHNMLDDFFSNGFFPSRNLMGDTFKVDVIENENDYVIEADLPGVNKEDVSIDFNEGRLIIAVNKEECTDSSNKNYIHQERRSISMARSIYLTDADSDAVKAKLENGVLVINVPKQIKQGSSRKISID